MRLGKSFEIKCDEIDGKFFQTTIFFSCLLISTQIVILLIRPITVTTQTLHECFVEKFQRRALRYRFKSGVFSARELFEIPVPWNLEISYLIDFKGEGKMPIKNGKKSSGMHFYEFLHRHIFLIIPSLVVRKAQQKLLRKFILLLQSATVSTAQLLKICQSKDVQGHNVSIFVKAQCHIHSMQ